MDCLTASYNWLPNEPPRFSVGLARQSGADTQPQGGPLRNADKVSATDLAYVLRTKPMVQLACGMSTPPLAALPRNPISLHTLLMGAVSPSRQSGRGGQA